MQRTLIRTSSLAALSAALTLASARAPRPGGIEVGDVAAHVFTSPLVNALGITSLEDLRGKPVLVDFWGTHCPPCVGAAVPASLKLQETFGADLQVIFVECQDSNLQQAAAFALAQKWLGGRAIWAKERPFESGFNMLPSCVLIGNDGRVLLKGNPLAQQNEIERQIAEQIKLSKSPPSTAPVCMHAAWAEFARGRYARGLELAKSAETEAAGDPTAIVAIRATLRQFQARLDAQFTRVQWLIDNGYFEEAVELLDGLGQSARSDPASEKRAAELSARLDSKELALERLAGKEFARLASRFFESAGDPELTREVERFAERNPGTKAAARATALVKLARVPKTGR